MTGGRMSDYKSRAIFKTVWMCPYCGSVDLDLFYNQSPGEHPFIDEFHCNECGLDGNGNLMTVTIFYDGHKEFEPGETDKEYKLVGLE